MEQHVVMFRHIDPFAFVTPPLLARGMHDDCE